MSKVKHVVLTKFKEGTSQEEIDKLLEELLDMTEVVPGIEDYVSGANNSPEEMSQGYTHGFVMTFENAAARDGYLKHPERERVKGLIMPHVESVVAVDFEV